MVGMKPEGSSSNLHEYS